MDATTPKGYLNIVAKNQRPGELTIQSIIEEYLGRGALPGEDKMIYISTDANGTGFPSEMVMKHIRKIYRAAGWKDLLFYKNAGSLFTIKLTLP